MGHRSDDIRVPRVCDRKSAHTEVLATGCTQLDVVSRVMMNSGLGQHGVIFYLTLPERWQKVANVVGVAEVLGLMMVVTTAEVVSATTRMLMVLPTRISNSYKKLKSTKISPVPVI